MKPTNNKFNLPTRVLLIVPTIISIILVLTRLAIMAYGGAPALVRHLIPLALVTINAYAVISLILKQKRLLGVYILIASHIAMLAFLLMPGNYLYPFFDWYSPVEIIASFVIKGLLFVGILFLPNYGKMGWKLLK